MIIFGGEIFTYIGYLALVEITIAKLLKSKSTLEPSIVDWFNVTNHSTRLKEMEETERMLYEDCEEEEEL